MNKIWNISIVIIILAIGVHATPKKGTMKDVRDGKTYKTIKIGKQMWMAENLNFITKESFCYENKSANCKKYGRLYDWYDAARVCPFGWHLPSKAEFERLFEYIDGQDVAGAILKSENGWNRCEVGTDGEERSCTDDGNGSDFYGFSALPGGRRISRGDYHSEGIAAFFWTSTKYNASNAYSISLTYYTVNGIIIDNNRNAAFSVRCLKN